MATSASAGPATPHESNEPLSTKELRKMHAYWRAANYLSVGQIYLYANPLLHEPLEIEHIKPRLLGHWGTTPGLNFIYVHFNRLIKKHDLNVIYVTGPGHGGPRFGCQHLPGGHLQRTVPSYFADGRRSASVVQAILFSGRYPKPRSSADTGVDS